MQDAKAVIAVFGTSKAEPGQPIYELAYNIGSELGANGYVLANGGYGGTMLAGAKGASEKGGKVIGVTCGAFKRSGANEFVSEQIRTDNLEQRLAKLIEIADAYIVLEGGTGTLLELASVWESRNKGFECVDKPIILMEKFWNPLLEMISRADAGCIEHLEKADNAKDAVAILEKYFG